jgi:hypothetical protein
LSFLLYTHIVFLINLYSTSGRNAPNASGNIHAIDDGNIELVSPGVPGAKWPYARVPLRQGSGGLHVLGDDEEEEEDMMAPHIVNRR